MPKLLWYHQISFWVSNANKSPFLQVKSSPRLFFFQIEKEYLSETSIEHLLYTSPMPRARDTNQQHGPDFRGT